MAILIWFTLRVHYICHPFAFVLCHARTRNMRIVNKDLSSSVEPFNKFVHFCFNHQSWRGQLNRFLVSLFLCASLYLKIYFYSKIAYTISRIAKYAENSRILVYVSLIIHKYMNNLVLVQAYYIYNIWETRVKALQMDGRQGHKV